MIEDASPFWCAVLEHLPWRLWVNHKAFHLYAALNAQATHSLGLAAIRKQNSVAVLHAFNE
jgi:hypothetical protein